MGFKSLEGWVQRNPEKRKEQSARLYLLNKKLGQLSRQRYPKQNKEVMRRGNLRRKYGITAEEYDEMSLRQRNRCAICKVKRSWRALAVDHCHKTGKVRALLCATCNNHLGVYEKNKEKFEDYIRRFK